jgi:hypothetical protein
MIHESAFMTQYFGLFSSYTARSSSGATSMQQFIRRLSLSTCALAAGIFVSACGGGGATAPGSTPSSFGWAVDGYLSGATVVCDSNGNGAQDAGETTTTTASDGLFRFTTACSSALIAFGGTNTDSGQPFTGVMRAPSGSSVVTPLTTLVAGGMSEAQVKTLLGVPDHIDIKTIDPALKIDGNFVEPDFLKKSLVVQQIVQKIGEALAALTGDTSDAAVRAQYGKAAQAVASAGTSSGLATLISGTTADLTALTALVNAAAQPGVANGVNPTTLAQIVSGGLKAQLEAILGATSSTIATVATTQQSDQKIKNHVMANSASLGAAPDAGTAALGTTLTNQVASGLGGGGSGDTGTLLVSFDEANPAFTGMGAYGGAMPTVEAGPSGGSGNALRLLKPASNVTWGGAFFTVARIPFTSDRKKLTARVNATTAGAVIKFKVEIAGGGSVEIVGSPTGAANTWSTVTWDFGAVNPSDSYTIIAITPDEFRTADGQSYYIDQITLAPAVVAPPITPGAAFISFDETVPAFTGMGAYGGALPTVEAGPAGGSANALKIVKPAGQMDWGGAFFGTATIPFTSSNKTISARVNSTRAGAVITFKVEVSGGSSVEVASTPIGAANTWSTVTWDFSAVNLANTYSVIAITPDFGVAPTGQAYFIDEIKVIANGGGGGAGSCGTTEPTCAATTTIPAGSVIIYSETAAVANFNPFPGWGQATLYSEATVAGNKSLKYTMLNYEGLDWTANPVDVSTKGKVHLDLWTPNLTSVKFYIISQNPTVDTVSVTIPLTAGIWNSVDLDLSSFVGPNKASISQMKFDTPLPGTGTLYVDNIYFWGAASVGGGGANLAGEMGSGGPQTMTVATASLRTPNGGLTFFVNGEGMFAADYVGSAEAFAPFNLAAWPNAHTASYPGTSILAGGSIGYFQDDVGLSNSANKITEGGYVVGSGLDPNGAPNFFRYFVMKGPALPNSYMGLFVNAPNNGTVNVSAFNRIKFRMWGPQKMYESTFHPQGVEVVLAGPKVAGCGTGSGGTEIAQTFNATQTIGAASQYKLLLSGFTVKGTCGSDTAQTAVASVLSQVARVVFAIPGTALNFTLPELNTNPPEYSMGINLGAIGFTNVP